MKLIMRISHYYICASNQNYDLPRHTHNTYTTHKTATDRTEPNTNVEFVAAVVALFRFNCAGE